MNTKCGSKKVLLIIGLIVAIVLLFPKTAAYGITSIIDSELEFSENFSHQVDTTSKAVKKELHAMGCSIVRFKLYQNIKNGSEYLLRAFCIQWGNKAPFQPEPTEKR